MIIVFMDDCEARYYTTACMEKNGIRGVDRTFIHTRSLYNLLYEACLLGNIEFVNRLLTCDKLDPYLQFDSDNNNLCDIIEDFSLEIQEVLYSYKDKKINNFRI